MNEIQITITIPEREYKDWDNYDPEDMRELIFELNSELRKYMDIMYIRNFDIEIDERKYGK